MDLKGGPKVRPLCFITCNFVNVDQIYTKFGQKKQGHFIVAHLRTQHLIVVRPTTVRAISTDIICQTIVQHCRTSDLELTATCRVKLRLSLSLSLSLYFQIQT